MTEQASAPAESASLQEVQQGWHELSARVEQLESAKAGLEKENKLLRELLERAIEHRQKSHGELVLLLTGLVSKLPLNDVGVIVSKLMEHNTNLSQYLAALIKGTADAPLPQPAVLQTLEQTRRKLHAAIEPLVQELLQLETPFESDLLPALLSHPEEFFSPRFVRANRCYLKGLIPRERVLREFGPEALVFFNDVTTDPKLNPRPKPEEIVLAFRNDFAAVFEQNPGLVPTKRQELLKLHQRVSCSRSGAEPARHQRFAFQRLSFLIELLYYYEHQNTEAVDVMFAQRLPALVEQLALAGAADVFEPRLIEQAEALLALVINPDHRLMVINNLGKTGGAGRTLKYVLRLRTPLNRDPEQTSLEFVRHLLTSAPRTPSPEAVAPLVRLLPPERQRLVLRAILHSDRLRKSEAEALGKTVAEQLGLASLAEDSKAQIAVPPEVDRRMAWARVKDLIARRTDTSTVAAAIRDRLNAKYDAEEIRESWLVLTETDPLSLIRIFCQFPYLPNGKTDPIARTVMEVYLTRLLHEKYARTYQKVVKSLRNMFKARPDAPTLVNFLALVRWVRPAVADKLSADIGIAAHAA
ncbi:MAG TPA: hypothetical protein VJA21_06515 [Verrucomicrobiae bacterium]